MHKFPNEIKALEYGEQQFIFASIMYEGEIATNKKIDVGGRGESGDRPPLKIGKR